MSTYKRYPLKWVNISDGDEMILQIVNSYGVVSAEQMYALLGGSMQYLSCRLQKLSMPMFDYLRRLEQRLGFGHYLYLLGKAGVKWLAQHNFSSKRRVFSLHTLYRSQVRSCITVACRESDVELAWYPEDRIKDRIIRHFRNVKGQKLKLSLTLDVFVQTKALSFFMRDKSMVHIFGGMKKTCAKYLAGL